MTRVPFFQRQPAQPDSLFALAKNFLTSIPLAPSTFELHEKHLRRFIRWCDKQGIDKACQLKEEIIQAYQDELIETATAKTGKPLTENGRYRRLVTVCRLLAWLKDHGHIPHNPLEHTMKLTAFWQQVPSSTDSLFALGQKYFQILSTLSYERATLYGYQSRLRVFILWCHERKIYHPSDLTEIILLEYRNDFSRPTEDHRHHISVLSGFLGWLVEEKFLGECSLARQKSVVKEFWQQTASATSMVTLAKKFFLSLQVNEYAAKSIHNYQDYLRYFIGWCHSRDIYEAPQVTKPLIESYQNHLYRYISTQTGQPLSAQFRSSQLIAVSQFFLWLTASNYLIYNPASEVQLPKIPLRLPRDVLSAKDARKILAQPDTSTIFGIRDRAILETLYSTAARRREILNLCVDDLSLSNQTVLIRDGKGHKDRYLPLTPSSLLWLEEYLTAVRPVLLRGAEQKILFLHNLGAPFSADNLGKLVSGYVKDAEVGKIGGFHLFRHSVATLMLERGADLRYIQELLGHRNLETTQIYTKVSIGKLKEVHERTHPGKNKPTKTQQLIDELGENPE